MPLFPSGCHLVGSVVYSDAETVFRECVARLPSRLKRIPDGETGNRSYFTAWQFAVFSSLPQCMAPFVMNQGAEAKDLDPAEVEKNIAKLHNLSIATGYDDAAIESYATFRRLKENGIISKRTRFQVCLPTGANVVIALHHQYRGAGFKVYETALFRAMRRLQDEIPAEELSIQIDLAVDTAFWEGAYEKPWFDDPKEGTMQYILRMISHVDQDVELGLHNCYGKSQHALPSFCCSLFSDISYRRHGAQTLDRAALPTRRDGPRPRNVVSYLTQDCLLSLPGPVVGHALLDCVFRTTPSTIPGPARPRL